MTAAGVVGVLAMIVGPAPSTPAAGPDAAAAMVASAESALADVRRRFGADARLLGVEILPEEVAVAVQDPAVPGHVNRHRYPAEGPVESEPLAVGRSARRLRARLFRAAEVDAAVLHRILPAAAGVVDTEDGAVTHAVLERSEGSSEVESFGAPRWRVHVQGPRGGGYVEYDLRGRRKRVVRW